MLRVEKIISCCKCKHVTYGLLCTFLFTDQLCYNFLGFIMRNIFIIQRRAIRIILRLGPRSSCREGLKKFGICAVPCLYIYSLMLFAIKNLNIYQTNSFVHGMNTKQQNKLHIPLVRPTSIQRYVYYSSVKIFNQLPQNIFKFCNNIQTSKTLLRDYFAENASYSIEEFLSAGHNDCLDI